MKRLPHSITARTTVGALTALIGLSFAILAIFPVESQSGQKRHARLAKRQAAAPIAVIPPAPVPSSPVYVGFENFEGPGTLTRVDSSSQGSTPDTVEYIAHDAGEPSIGVNWNTNVTAFQSDLQTLFVTFNDNCIAPGPKDTWVNRQAPTSQGADQDPIGFVDRTLGRTFSAQLTLTTPTCKTSYTDNDGGTWVATQGFGIGSGIDHQTIGGGPYHAVVGVPPPPDPVYPHALYYCSQLPQAGCARSDTGGVSFGPVVPIDPPADAHCVGIHGHVKVAPDGTVYVPTCNCDGNGSVIVSTDNGVSWTIRHVPGTSPTLSGSTGNIIDAQVAVDDNNRVYYAMANAPGGFAVGSNPVVATSDDQGQTWQHIFDIGATFGIHNIEFPYPAAADKDRAAVAFLGSTTGGDPSVNGFNGTWHLYVATTFDGGSHWTTTDATPNDPLQRGCVWNKGGANICRNLLDFIGASVDKEGRIEVGYVDGCADGTCDQATQAVSHFIGNGYTARGAIARQSSGPRLVAQFNPTSATSPPGMPLVNARRVNGIVHLAWSEADSGNLMVSNYKILRGTSPGTEAPLTTVSGTQTGGSFDDVLAPNDTQDYYYKVIAVSDAQSGGGESCPKNELFVPWVGDTCTGLVLQRNPADHSEQTTQGQTPPSLAIDYIAVAEPPNTSNLQFKMKVTDLSTVPPNSRWRIVWNWEGANGQQFYVGMRTGAPDPNNGNVPPETFEYGTIATAVVGLVLGVPTETMVGPATGTATPDGLITINVPKSAVGNPQIGDLLGAVNGRTFTGDTGGPNGTANLERSNLLMDHTFVKGQRDNGHPAATYMIAGNNSCSTNGIAPISAVSRKTHGNGTTHDIALPLTGPAGIECRSGGASNDHTVVVTFPAPITAVASATCGGQAATTNKTGSVVQVNCTGVTDAQLINVTLTGVSDGTNTGNVSIPMGILFGDVDASKHVDAGDIDAVQRHNSQNVGNDNFRADIDLSGHVDAGDIGYIQNNNTHGF
jgi:hypothetical protein